MTEESSCRVKVISDFSKVDDDELDIIKGDIIEICVTDFDEEEWFNGLNTRTNMTGNFPKSHVELLPAVQSETAPSGELSRSKGMSFRVNVTTLNDLNRGRPRRQTKRRPPARIKHASACGPSTKPITVDAPSPKPRNTDITSSSVIQPKPSKITLKDTKEPPSATSPSSLPRTRRLVRPPAPAPPKVRPFSSVSNGASSSTATILAEPEENLYSECDDAMPANPVNPYPTTESTESGVPASCTESSKTNHASAMKRKESFFSITRENPNPEVSGCESKFLRAPQPKPVFRSSEVIYESTGRGYGLVNHGPMNKEAAVVLLKETGNFLVRESERSPGSFCLAFRIDDEFKHYKLYFEDGEHFVGQSRFPNVSDLVADGLHAVYIAKHGHQFVPTKPPLPTRTSTSQQRSSPSTAAVSVPAVPADTPPVRETHRSTIPSLSDGNRATANRGKDKSWQFDASDFEKSHIFSKLTYRNPTWCDVCHDFMWGLRSQGVQCKDCHMNAHNVCSTLPSECKPKLKLFQRVFGSDLTAYCKAHDVRLPHILLVLVGQIEKHGLSSEGIYRLSGSKESIHRMKLAFDTNTKISIENNDLDINSCASLLKLYLRELPDPLLPIALYDEFVAAGAVDDVNDQIDLLIAAVDKLPLAHFESLNFLLKHFQHVVARKDINKMSPQNLGVVFGPTLLSCPGKSLSQVAEDTSKCNIAVQTLIEYYNDIFVLDERHEPLGGRKRKTLRRICTILEELKDSKV